MARSAASFARGKPRFKPQARVLVLCEDSKSCLEYLQDAARHFRSYAEVSVVHCGKTDPKNIVIEALNRRHAFEKVYCVIDRDNHHNFHEALDLAATNTKIAVIRSYPCYEFWLLLHFRKSRKPYMPVGKFSAGDLVLKDLRAESGMADYGKGNSKGLFDRLLTQLPDARKRAEQVLEEAHADNEFNPSTWLHELITLFETLGQPHAIM